MITKEQTVEVLNDIFKTDKDAIRNLIEYRVPCNDALKDHPTVQVLCKEDGSDPKVGLLGIINGIFGVNENDSGNGFIWCQFDEDGELLGFSLKE